MSWSVEFDEPIVLASGKKLRTLREAADHVIALPAKEAKLERWQTAMVCLLSAAENGGPTMMARIGMVQAINADQPLARPEPRRNAAKKYKLIR